MSQDDANDEAEMDLHGFRSQPDQQGLSLDQLSESFARLLGEGETPYEESGLSEAPDAVLMDDEPPDQIGSVSPESILESILFVGHPDNEPISSRTIASLMRGVRAAEVEAIIQQLNEDYQRDGCPYMIESVGKGFRMTLRPEFHFVRERFYGQVREAQLSQPAINALALVAYNQPIAKQSIVELAGEGCGRVLSQLVRRGLLSAHRVEGQGTKLVYETTDRFLDVFGLASLEDLPQSRDLAEG